jgi:hypothetical protein
MEKTYEQTWMMRGLDDKRSLVFSIVVSVESEGELFAATVMAMEDQMAAYGRTEEEAADNARLLFKATVDDALARNASISHATGQHAITMEIPISDAPKFFHFLERRMLADEAQLEDWIAISVVQSHGAHAD